MPKKLFLDPRDAAGIAEIVTEILESKELRNASPEQKIEAITKRLTKRLYLEDDSTTRIEEPDTQEEIARKLGLPENPPPGYTSMKGDPNPVTEEITIEELRRRRKILEEAN
jgi:hypothetical protein